LYVLRRTGCALITALPRILRMALYRNVRVPLRTAVALVNVQGKPNGTPHLYKERELSSSTPVSVPLDEFNRLQDEWSLVIGRFFVTFTSCEYWTYLFIETFGSSRLREAVGPMNLSARADMAHALLSDLELVDGVQVRVDKAFASLTRLAGQRNVLAHNGPMAHVYRNDDSGELVVRHELRSARDPNRQLDLDDIRRLQGEAVTLDEELALLFGLVRQPKSRKPVVD
jgi:hypothetical protein